ncbi:glycosyltransferase family 2 protein [Cupriavidus gilardii]|uniref:glycosyltransferase family 2 protein n=1 Tax=Cupriavidus gilardii TaxID=82541 RepID=UPI001EE56D7C|nr:glycosyltransferase [Cupriavidus gilardii]MCG5260332.1 glycosyltransferase [Cupriavidus gilardii]
MTKAATDSAATMTRPLVSVIVPCYNQGQYLEDALQSAEAAYSGPLEIIVVDDGSTEARTIRALGELRASRAALHIVRQPNGGLSNARNTGLGRASGAFVQFLDTDDLLVPGKIDKQIEHFSIVPRLDVSISNYMLCDDTRIACSKVESAISTSSFELSDFLFHWERGLSIPIHCGLFRREILDGMRFEESLRAKEDWVFWCTLKLRRAKMAYFPLHGAVYRQHAESMRRSYLRMGDSWLCAAAKIRAAMPAHLYPGFMDAAVSWHAECYRKHPIYAKELEASNQRRDDRLRRGEAPSSSRAAIGVSGRDEGRVRELAAKLAALPPLDGTPLISVVIPIFNHYEFLFACLDSVVMQSTMNFEVVCIDDASTDSRVGALLDALEGASPRLRILRREQNRGISANQNEAVQVAQGDYLAFVDCDDALAESALTIMAEEIASHPRVDYFFTDRLDIDDDGKVIRHTVYGGYDHIVPSAESDIRADLLDGMIASHLKVIRRAAYLRAGGTTDRFSGIQDWELALRIAEFGEFRYIPQPLYHHRIHARSVSRSDARRQFYKSNLLRREYQSKWLRPASMGIDGDLTGEPVIYFDEAMPSLVQLKSCWQQGLRCHAVLGRQTSPGVLNFLRQFNSYFDRIVYEDVSSWVALVGYVWADILQPAARDGFPSAPCQSHGDHEPVVPVAL